LIDYTRKLVNVVLGFKPHQTFNPTHLKKGRIGFRSSHRKTIVQTLFLHINALDPEFHDEFKVVDPTQRLI